LKPGSMPSPRSLNAAISPQTESAIMWGLAMHPSDRPSTVSELRGELLTPGPISRTVARLFDQERPLSQFFRVNRGLLAFIGALILAAALITARPATLPLPPTSTPTVTPTSTATYTPTATPTVAPSPTATPTPTATPAPTATPTPWHR
jgi:hypothetical protein